MNIFIIFSIPFILVGLYCFIAGVLKKKCLMIPIAILITVGNQSSGVDSRRLLKNLRKQAFILCAISMAVGLLSIGIGIWEIMNI